MARQTGSGGEPWRALQALAMGYPEARETVVCSRTAFKARDKSFLFVGTTATSYDAMVKLGPSQAQAAALASREPGRYKVGGHGWVTATFGREERPPAGLLEGWIDESYRLTAPKALVAQLGPGGPGAPAAARGPGPGRGRSAKGRSSG